MNERTAREREREREKEGTMNCNYVNSSLKLLNYSSSRRGGEGRTENEYKNVKQNCNKRRRMVMRCWELGLERGAHHCQQQKYGV